MGIKEFNLKIEKLLNIGSIAWTCHASKQMKDPKRRFDAHDVIRALRAGRITFGPQKNTRGGGIECRKECQLSDGRKCEVRFTIEMADGEEFIRIITVVPK